MKLLTPWVVISLSWLATTASAQELTVKEVLDRWDAGTRLIQSYDLHITMVIESHRVFRDGVNRLTKPGEEPLIIKYQSHILKDGVKRFGQFTPDPNGEYTSELADDGVTFISAEKTANNYVIDSGHGPFGSVEQEDYEAIYRTAYGTADRIALSKERPARLLPREGNLYVVDVPTAQSSNMPNTSWRVWLDPTRNFMPRRWSEWLDMSGQRLHNVDCELQLAEVTPGVWAPVGSKLSAYNKNKESAVFGKAMGVDTLQVDMQRSRFNVPIPATSFVIKIPNGATVVDRARNIVYTQGASDPEAYLRKLADDGDQALADLSPKDRLPRNSIIVPDLPRFWTKGRIKVAWSALVAVCLVVLVATWRRRRIA